MYMRALPAGFVPPCLPTKAPAPPSGALWLHEIKHDGFRIVARKDGKRVRLYSRPGNDLTYRFPLIVEALAELRSRSCIIDGEAVPEQMSLAKSPPSAVLGGQMTKPQLTKGKILALEVLISLYSRNFKHDSSVAISV